MCSQPKKQNKPQQLRIKKTFTASECLLRLDIKASSTYLELCFPLNVKGSPAA